MLSKCVGIDLGTTNSCVSYLDKDGKPAVIKDKTGKSTIPSVVNFDGDKVVVGIVAKRKRIVFPDKTISSSKRHIGTDHVYTIDNKKFKPEQISAFILSEIKKNASEFLGEPVDEAVITVPAYFTDKQRTATKDAAEIAGLKVLRIINEPTAAALAYKRSQILKTDNNDKKNEYIMVYDLGGGTFDVSILNIDKTDDTNVFEVVATSGDNHLGGDDFDNRLVEWLSNKIESDIKTKVDKTTHTRLVEEAERAKCDLSSVENTQIQLPYINGQEYTLDVELSRNEFETLTKDLIDKTIQPLKQALEDAKLKKTDIDKVILVGGSTRMPCVFNTVKEFFDGKSPYRDLDPDEVVSLGATIEAGVKKGTVSDLVLIDVTPMSLGIVVMGELTDHIIKKNTSIPTELTKTYTTFADNQSTVQIVVVQGEYSMADKNHQLGQFMLDVPPRKAGEVTIDVTFSINEDGMLEVTAKENINQLTQNIKIQRGSMTEAEKEQAKKDITTSETLDKLQERLFKVKSQYEQTIKYINNLLEKNQDITQERKHQLETLKDKINDNKQNINIKDVDNITNESVEKVEKLLEDLLKDLQ